jgi:hypothetical protein
MTKAREWGPLSPRLCGRDQPLYEDPPRLVFQTSGGRLTAKRDMLSEIARAYAHGAAKMTDVEEAAVAYTRAKDEARR